MAVLGQRHSIRRKPKRRRVPPGLAPKPQITVRIRSDDDSQSLAAYQRQICELELTVTALRETVAKLTTQAESATSSRAHFANLFEHAPMGYVVHNQTGVILEINRAAALLLGTNRDEPSVNTMAQFVPKEEVLVWLEHIRRCRLLARNRSQLHLRVRGGRVITVELMSEAVPSPLGRPPSLFRTAIVDISEHERARTALARTQQNYHQLIDTIEGVVWEANAQTVDCTFVSGYAERLLGYPVADWLRPGFWFSHIHLDDRERVRRELAGAVARKERTVTEYRVVTTDRRVLWLHDNITTVIRDGELRLLGVAVDVTHRREAEEAMRLAHDSLEQRVAERTAELRQSIVDLEAFSYSASHDLRSPLRAMLGFAELGLQHGNGQLPPKVEDCLQRILKGATRADRLVQDLLTYSRVSRANMTLKRIGLEELVHEVVGQNVPFQPPRAEIVMERPLLPVLGHEPSLIQCVTNFLSNATKFVPAGTVPRVRIRTETVEGQVRVWFQDNGIGIEKKDLGRIFGIFERLQPVEQYEGTGIGLAIVRKAAERMGGSVGVESKPQQGSRFWIQLKGVPPNEQVDTTGRR